MFDERIRRRMEIGIVLMSDDSFEICIPLEGSFKILNMSNNVGQPTRLQFGQKYKLLWLTKYFNFHLLATNKSATTV